jgi:hypothetical protein
VIIVVVGKGAAFRARPVGMAPITFCPLAWIDTCSDHRLVYLHFKQPQNMIHKNPCLRWFSFTISKLMELVPVISLAIGIQQVASRGLSRKGGGKGGGGESMHHWESCS